MAGTVLDGELSASRQPDVAPAESGNGVPRASRTRVRYAIATSADDPSLRRLLRETPMHGAISLSFEREPDYFAGAHLAGADDVTIVAYENDRLVCMGRCTTRECWLNGAARRVRYLGELRLGDSAQGRFDILRGGYRFFHELQVRTPADFTFTSIAADNVRARRLLERGVTGLPRYEFLNEFETIVIKTGGPRRERRDSLRCDWPPEIRELTAFLNSLGQHHQLAAVWTEERLRSLAGLGLALDDFVVVRAADGRVLGAASLWDQRAFRQTVIRGYSRVLKAARPLINLAAHVFGTPHLPKPGTVLAHAFLSPLAIAPEHDEHLPLLVESAAQRAAQCGLEFLTLGFAAGDPRLARVRRHFSCRTYTSRLYRVHWAGSADSLALDPRPLLPEIAFL